MLPSRAGVLLPHPLQRPVLDVLPVLGLDCGEQALDMRWGDGFEVETILNVRAAKAGLRIVDVPGVAQPRMHGESKLNAVRDGLRILRVMLTELRHRPPFAATPADAPEEPAGKWQPSAVEDPDHRGAGGPGPAGARGAGRGLGGRASAGLRERTSPPSRGRRGADGPAANVRLVTVGACSAGRVSPSPARSCLASPFSW